MFERFTDLARRVVVLAQEEARRLNHNYIGTEHMLLGLLHEERGLAAHALTDMGMSLEAARVRVLETVGVGQKPPTGHIPFTPRTKKVLEYSLREALQLNTAYIGTEHLLLGLVREGEGLGAQILADLGGGSLEAVRMTVIALYERQAADETAEEAAGEAHGAQAGGAAGGQGGRGGGVLRGFVQGRGGSRGGGGPFAGAYLSGSAHFPARVTDPVVPREAEAQRLLTVVSRRERNNALIVGPSGAGKSALVRGLSQLFSSDRGPASLGEAEVLEFDLLTLRTRAEQLVRRHASSIVLVEDLDALLAGNEASGGRLAMGLVGLAEAEAPVVVTATAAALALLERSFPSISARFEVVELAAAGRELTLEILRALRPALNEFHHVLIEDSALEAALELGAAATGRVLPGAAVDLLDTSAARLAAGLRAGGGERDAVLGAERLRADHAGEGGGQGVA